MAQDLFGAFMNGWNFVEDIKDREARRQELDILRSRRQMEWGREDEKYRDAQELKWAEEASRRFDAHFRNADGSYKNFEDATSEGRKFLYDLANDPHMTKTRNTNNMDVRVSNVYGRGQDVIFEADWRDPNTGEVRSRGPLTVGRTNDPSDPVRVLKIPEMGKALAIELQAKNAKFAERWQAGQAMNAQTAAERKLLDTLDVPGGQGAASGGPPPRNAAEFAQRMLPAAMNAAGGDQEEALVMMAQAALETGWGRSAPGNNYFGVKGGDGPQLATTEVDPHGNPYSTTAAFRQYGSMEESAAGRQQFLAENPRYAKAGYFNARTAEEKADALQRAEYATDPQYASKLKAIIAQLRSSAQAGGGAVTVAASGTPEAPRMYPDPKSPRGYAGATPKGPGLQQGVQSAAPVAGPYRPTTEQNKNDIPAVRELARALKELEQVTEVMGRRRRDILDTGLRGGKNDETALRAAEERVRVASSKLSPNFPATEVAKRPNAAFVNPQRFVAELANAGFSTPDRPVPQPQLGDRPIDPNRPAINNPDGTISTERTITVEADGKYYLIPTIVNGRQLTPEQAIEAVKAGQNQPVGVYATAQEAEAAAVARSQRIGQVRGGGAQSSPAPSDQVVAMSPQPKSALTPEQQVAQREALLEYRKYDKSMTLEKIAEIMRTGRLDGRKLKFITNTFTGAISVLDEDTGERIAHHEDPGVEQLRRESMGSKKSGGGSTGGGGKSGSAAYAKDRMESVSKMFHPHWAKRDGKHEPEVVMDDLRRTIALELPQLIQAGFPPDPNDWTERHWDRYLEWYRQSRQFDHKTETTLSDWVPGYEAYDVKDSSGTLDPAVMRGQSAQEPFVSLPDGRRVDLQAMVARGVAPNIEAARQMVEQALRAAAGAP